MCRRNRPPTCPFPHLHLHVPDEPAVTGEAELSVAPRWLHRHVAAEPVVLHPVALLLQAYQQQAAQGGGAAHLVLIHLGEGRGGGVEGEMV